jgi:hypothetical protein
LCGLLEILKYAGISQKAHEEKVADLVSDLFLRGAATSDQHYFLLRCLNQSSLPIDVHIETVFSILKQIDMEADVLQLFMGFALKESLIE